MTSLSDLQVISMHMHALCRDLLDLRPQLAAAVKESADGYPRASISEGRGGAGQEPEVGDDGKPVTKNGRVVMGQGPPSSDPTLSAVLSRNEGHSGQVQAALRQVDSAMVSARRMLESARGRALHVLTPPEEPPAPKAEDLCANCLSHGAHSPVGSEAQHAVRAKRWGKGRVHADLCDWCASFLESHGRRPPKVLVVKHKDGQRIYDRDVREAMAR